MLRGGIVFLHGSGDCGVGFKEWLNDTDDGFLQTLSDMGFITLFPSAPRRPYSLSGGCISYVWHDRTDLDINGAEDTSGVQEAVTLVDDCIETLLSSGVPLGSVFIYGLSMGGHVALQSVLYSKYASGIAGIVGLSCFISQKSPFWESIEKDSSSERRVPPLLMMHGTSDDMVSHEWGDRTSSRLKGVNGLNVVFKSVEGLGHDLSPSELSETLDWIEGILSQNECNDGTA